MQPPPTRSLCIYVFFIVQSRTKAPVTISHISLEAGFVMGVNQTLPTLLSPLSRGDKGVCLFLIKCQSWRMPLCPYRLFISSVKGVDLTPMLCPLHHASASFSFYACFIIFLFQNYLPIFYFYCHNIAFLKLSLYHLFAQWFYYQPLYCPF